ncbi:MAG TPA: hypothetical protein V6D18_11210 [Thermosynechococcaceae cyanobacterium]
MQGQVVELIRELMQTQRMSVRKISAQIAREHGGSDLGYTQQINRILNDPDYDPNFSTVQKVLAALNCSLWQSAPASGLERMDARIDRLGQDIAALKATVDRLCEVVVLATQLNSSPSALSPWETRSQLLPIEGEKED